MDEESRDECCQAPCDCGDKPCEPGPEPCCEGSVSDGLLSVNSTGLNGIQFSDGMSYASSGTFSTGNPSQPKIKMKDVIIKEMDHGYLVKIGCQTLCIESPKTLLKALKKYMKDPDAVENQHMSGEFMESLK